MQVVEDEQQVARDVVLEDVGDERRGRLRPGQDVGLARRFDGALDRRGEVRRELGQGQPQRGDDPGGERPELAIAAVERVPRRRHLVREMGDQRRFAEPRTGDDDGEPPPDARCQSPLELGAVQRAGRVGRWQQLGPSSGGAETWRARLRTRVDRGRRGHGPPGA